MASTTDGCCLNDPNFAVICSFISNFGDKLILPEISFEDLQESIEDTKTASDLLVDLHVHLLRRIGKKVTTEKWQRSVVKFCHYFDNADAWEIEQNGYEKAKVSTKLKVLKNLLETQFDLNLKFKDKIGELDPTQLRLQPLGRDISGGSYWYLIDKELNLRIYREEHPTLKDEDEVWKVICRDRDDLASLVATLDAEINTKTEDETQDPKMEGNEKEEKIVKEEETDSSKSLQQNELGDQSDSKINVREKIAAVESCPVKNLEIKEDPDCASVKSSVKISSCKKEGTELRTPIKTVIEDGCVKVEPRDDIPKSTEPMRQGEGAENLKKKEKRMMTALEGTNKTTSESNEDKIHKSLENVERNDINKDKKGNTDSMNESKAEKRKLEFSEETEIESKSRKECSDNVLSGSRKISTGNCKSEKLSETVPKEVETTSANFRRESVIKIGKRIDKVIPVEESAKQNPCETKEKLSQNKLAIPVKQEKEMKNDDVVVISDTDKDIEVALKSKEVTKRMTEINKSPECNKLKENASLEMNKNIQYIEDEHFDDKIVLMKEYSKDSEQMKNFSKDRVSSPAIVINKPPALASEEKVQNPHDVKNMLAAKTSASDKIPPEDHVSEAKKSILEESVNKLHSVGDCAEKILPKKCNIEKTEKASGFVHMDSHSQNNESRDNCKVLDLSKKENKFQNNDSNLQKASEDKQKEINVEKKSSHKISNFDKESPNDDKLQSSKKNLKFEHKSLSSDKESHTQIKSQGSEEKTVSESKSRGTEERQGSKSKPSSSGEEPGTKNKSRGSEGELDARGKSGSRDDGPSTGSKEEPGGKKKSHGSEEEPSTGKKSRGSEEERGTGKKSHGCEEKLGDGKKSRGGEEEPSTGRKSHGGEVVPGSQSKPSSRDDEQSARSKSHGSVEELSAQKKSSGGEKEQGTGKKAHGGEVELGSQSKPSNKEEGQRTGSKSHGSEEKLAIEKKSSGNKEEPAAGKKSHGSKEESASGKKSSGNEGELAPGKKPRGNEEESAPGKKPRGNEEEPAPGKKPRGNEEEPAPGKKPRGNEEEPAPGKKPRSNEEEPAPGKKPRSNEEEPAPGKKPRGNEEEPAPGKKPRGNEGEPAPGKKPRGNEEEPAPGKKPRGNEGEPAPGKKPRGNEEEPASGKKPRGKEGEPAPGKKSHGNEGELASGKKSSGNEGEPVPGKKSHSSEGEPATGKKSHSSEGEPATGKKSHSSEGEPATGKKSSGIEGEPAPGKKPRDSEEESVAGEKSRRSEEDPVAGKKIRNNQEESCTGSKSRGTDKLMDTENKSKDKKMLKIPNDDNVVSKQPQDKPKTEVSLGNESQKSTNSLPSDELPVKNTDDQHHSENLYELKASLDKIQTTVDEEIAAGNEEKKLTCKIVIKRKTSRKKDCTNGADDPDDDSDKMAKDTEDDIEYKCELSSASVDDKAEENEKNDCTQRVRKRKACDKLPVTPSLKNDRKTTDDLGNNECSDQIPNNDKDELLQDENKNLNKELDSKEGCSDTEESNVRTSRRLRARKTRSSGLEMEKTTELSKGVETTQGNSGQNADPENEALVTKKTRSRRRTQAELICTDLIIPEEEKRTRGRKRQNTIVEDFTIGEALEEIEPKKAKGSKNFRKTNMSRLKDDEQFSSQSDSDDMPLSKMTKATTRGRARGRGRSKGSRQPFTVLEEPTPVTRKSSRAVKKRGFNSNDFDTSHVRSRNGTGRSPRGGSATAAKGPRGRQRKKRSGSVDSDKWVSDKTEGEEEEEDDDEEEEEELFVGELLRRSSRVRSLSTKNKLLCVTSSDEEKSETNEDTSDEEFQLPKGRNARRAAARSAGTKEAQKIDENDNDKPCCHCQKFDHPETILLCDKCDAGYHTLCLTPPLHIIPEGDWFCPPCEHKMLLEKLTTNLHELDLQLKKRERLIKRKERLAFVGISLDNILSEKKENMEPNVDCPTQSVSATRTCRARRSINYKFTEFDELIDSAIQDDPRTVTDPEIEGAAEDLDDSSQNGKDISNSVEGPVSRGKDMDTIMNVYSDTNDLRPQGIQAKKEAGRRRGKDISNLVGKGSDSDEQYPAPRKRRPKRKLTTLDSDSYASESDEYKASEDSDVSVEVDVSEYSEEEEDDDDDDDDEDYGYRRRSSRTSTRQNYRASRKSRRGTRRSRRNAFDDFVVDDDYDSDESANYRRSTRASVKRKVNYRERASDEEEEMTPTEDSEESSAEFSGLGSDDSVKPNKKLKLKLAKKKTKRIIRESLSDDDDDDDDNDKSSRSSDSGATDKNQKKLTRKRRLAVSDSESSSSGHSESGARRSRRASTQKMNIKKLLDSDSDEESDKMERQYTMTKQKKNAILSDSDSIASDDKSSIKSVPLDKKDNDSKSSHADDGAANDEANNVATVTTAATTTTTAITTVTTPSTSATSTTTTTNNNNSCEEHLKEGQQNEDNTVDSSFSQMNGHDNEKKDKKDTHLEKTENRTIATERHQEDNCNNDSTKDDTSKSGTSTSRSGPQVLP